MTLLNPETTDYNNPADFYDLVSIEQRLTNEPAWGPKIPPQRQLIEGVVNDLSLPYLGAGDGSMYTQLPTILGFQPDVILFTAVSAIPIADVVRGVYDELRETLPSLGHIATKDRLVKGGLVIANRGSWSASVDTEASRLRPFVEEARVGIVDQYTFTGKTLSKAAMIAHDAGAASILLTPGRWFHQAYGVNIDALTSPVGPKLYEVGLRLARLLAQARTEV